MNIILDSANDNIASKALAEDCAMIADGLRNAPPEKESQFRLALGVMQGGIQEEFKKAEAAVNASELLHTEPLIQSSASFRDRLFGELNKTIVG